MIKCRQSYVCGFMFNDEGEMVVLIEKKKGPEILIGRLNGVGGKIEEGEYIEKAMVREFYEETGVLTKDSDWVNFLDLNIDINEEAYDRVYFFRSFNNEYFNEAKTRESEEIVKKPTHLIGDRRVVENLKWIIPMALSENLNSAFVYEEY